MSTDERLTANTETPEPARDSPPSGSAFENALAKMGPSIAGDPRARAALRIGVMGHRSLDPASARAIEKTAATIFRSIRAAALASLSTSAGKALFRPDFDFAVISPLAEGADRLLARAGMSEGCILGAILPFPAPDYEQTFDLGDREGAKKEFRSLLDLAELPSGFGILTLDGEPAAAGRDDAFAECARTINRWSDIAVSILSGEQWNSQTGSGVRDAIELGIPSVVLDPATPSEFSLWVDGERVPSADANARLAATVAQILAPDYVETSLPLFKRYIDEAVHYDPARDPGGIGARNPFAVELQAPAWARWCMGFNERLLRLGAAKRRQKQEVTKLDFEAKDVRPIASLLLRHYRADAIANGYAELHRSAQVAVVALGVLAMALAAVNVFGVLSDSPLMIGLAFLEFVTIGIAGGMVYLGRQKQWLDRWLDARLLAEVFRYSQFLLLVGRPTPFLNERISTPTFDGSHAWTREHAMRALRAQRLDVPGRGRLIEDSAVKEIRSYLVTQCIDDQINYHRKTAETRRGFGQRLRSIGAAALVLTFLIVAAKIADILIEEYMKQGKPPDYHIGLPMLLLRQTLDFFAIVTPAVAAALLALRAFGEHDVIAKRSAIVAQNLRAERERVVRAQTLRTLGEDMLRVARLLLSEVDGWFEVFADKRLE
jgi:hypothetical protein